MVDLTCTRYTTMALILYNGIIIMNSPKHYSNNGRKGAKTQLHTHILQALDDNIIKGQDGQPKSL